MIYVSTMRFLVILIGFISLWLGCGPRWSLRGSGCLLTGIFIIMKILFILGICFIVITVDVFGLISSLPPYFLPCSCIISTIVIVCVFWCGVTSAVICTPPDPVIVYSSTTISPIFVSIVDLSISPMIIFKCCWIDPGPVSALNYCFKPTKPNTFFCFIHIVVLWLWFTMSNFDSCCLVGSGYVHSPHPIIPLSYWHYHFHF